MGHRVRSRQFCKGLSSVGKQPFASAHSARREFAGNGHSLLCTSNGASKVKASLSDPSLAKRCW